jgi:hypothetical protein
LTNQKHHVSLYTNGARHIAEFKAQYPRVKTGTGLHQPETHRPIPGGVEEGHQPCHGPPETLTAAAWA